MIMSGCRDDCIVSVRNAVSHLSEFRVSFVVLRATTLCISGWIVAIVNIRPIGQHAATNPDMFLLVSMLQLLPDTFHFYVRNNGRVLR